jgi:hypothetical protein
VFEARVRALLEEVPDMPTTVLAERIAWTGSIWWYRDNVTRLRPEHPTVDPADWMLGPGSPNTRANKDDGSHVTQYPQAVPFTRGGRAA